MVIHRAPRHEIGEIGDPQSLPEDQDAGDQTAQQDDAQKAEPDDPGSDVEFLGDVIVCINMVTPPFSVRRPAGSKRAVRCPGFRAGDRMELFVQGLAHS